MTNLLKKEFGFAIAWSIIWSFAVPSWALESARARALCLQHVKVLQNARKAAMPIEALMSVASRHDLVFIGESHFEEFRRSLYRTMLKSLLTHDRRFNCLFTENSATAEGAIQLEKCNEDRGLLDTAKFESEKETACESGSSPWKGLENEAYRNGMRVYAVDSYEECTQDPQASGATINNCRDQFMRDRIQHWIDAGMCDKAVVVNGFPHVTSITKGHLTLAHRSFRDASGQPSSVFRISFLFSDYDTTENTYDPRWRWSDWRAITKGPGPQRPICGEVFQPSVVGKTFAFLNSALGVQYHPYAWMNDRPVGNWLDFDGSIVVGQDDGEKAK